MKTGRIKIFYIYFLMFGVIFFQCSKKIQTKLIESEPIHKLVSLSKSSCFGKCAVYNLTIYNDGLAIFEGKENVEKIGVYHKMLNAVEFDKVQNAVHSIKWNNYKTSYMRNIPDLPVSTLSYYIVKDSSKIAIQSNSALPPELEELHKNMVEIANDKVWILALKEKEIHSKDIILNELQIDLDSTQTAEHLEEIFIPYEFKKVKRLSEYMNFYLFTFNNKKISAYEMVVLARRIKGVRLVSFNKKLSPRDDF